MNKALKDASRVNIVFTCPADWVPDVPQMLKDLAERHTSIELPVDLPNLLNTIERLYIDGALARTNGNRTQAAKLLGLLRTTLCEKILSNAQKLRRSKSRPRTTTGPIPPRPRDETNEEE